jgi:hypothetical protein
MRGQTDHRFWPEAAGFRAAASGQPFGDTGRGADAFGKAARDPTRTPSLSQQHGCEGIIGRAFGLRRWRAQFRRPMNLMISRVRPNCRSRDSRWARGKCNAADREHCEGEKSASRFDGHFDPP